LVAGRFLFRRHKYPDYQRPVAVMAYDDGLFRSIDDEMQEALA
jgi:hypothetical protein